MPSSTREDDVAYKGFQGPGRGERRASPSSSGRALVARLDFGPLAKPLEVKVAHLRGRRGRRDRQSRQRAGRFRCDPRRDRARRGSKALGAVDIDAPAPMRTNLYTALYHALLAPSCAGDADGRYRGPDNQVHKADGFTFHSTFSLWDTFRAEHPLLTLIQPEQTQRRFHQLADRQPAGQPVRHPAGLAVPGARDLDA